MERPGRTRTGRLLRAWMVPGLDEHALRERKGRLGGWLYLIADVYIAIVSWQNPHALIWQTFLVVAVAVTGLVLLALPWRRLSDAALVWPVLGSALVTTLGEGVCGALAHFQPIFALALGYAGLVLRPGRTSVLAGLNLGVVGLVALLGLQRERLIEIAGAIIFSALIGELIATAAAAQRRQLGDLERLHDGLRPLLGAQTEHDAAQLVSELAANLLRADGVITMVTDRDDPACPGRETTLSARGGARTGSEFAGVRTELHTQQSGVGVVARTRKHLFVADARGHPMVSQTYVRRFGCVSVLFVPIVVGDRLIGVIVMWWTSRTDDLDHFTDQMVELLSIQAGPVLERVRQVEDLDRAATTDPLTGVLNRRAFEEGMGALADDAILLLFDLDRFKQLNDTQGHPAGDRVLRAFAAALASSVRDGFDLVCRIGGDEFAVLARGDAPVAQSVLDRLRAAWRSPEGVGYSAGFALRRPGEPREELGARADAALYEEKKQRRRERSAGG